MRERPPTSSRPRRSHPRSSPTCVRQRTRRPARANARGGARHARRPQPPGDRGDAAGRRGTAERLELRRPARRLRQARPDRAAILRDFSFVPGVRAHRHVPRARHRAAGGEHPRRRREAAPGTVRFGACTRVTGTLGGRRFDIERRQGQARRVSARGEWPSLAAVEASSPAFPRRDRRLARRGALCAAGYPERVANALAQETSPYLRQHAHNPVDWLPWGPPGAGSARARGQAAADVDRLFRLPLVPRDGARILRGRAYRRADERDFVCVKVDREERPDVDAMYMEAVQRMTGRGGWPLNVFLTPEQLPFYGGTYFPPEPRHGMPAWTQVLQAIAESWEHNREEIRAGGERLRERLSGRRAADGVRAPRPSERLSTGGGAAAGRASMLATGASAAAPEVPAGARARVAAPARSRGARRWRCRRSTRWPTAASTTSSPGASPATASTPAGRCRTSRRCSTTTRCSRGRTCTAGRSPTSERLREVCGARSSGRCARCAAPRAASTRALDADSEGVEGRFYVWTVAELRDVLGEDADAAIAWFGATEQGNFEDPDDPAAGPERAPGARPANCRRRRAGADPRAAAGGARTARRARRSTTSA